MQKKWMIFGATGWIGSKIIKLLIEQEQIIHTSKYRLEQRESITKEIDIFKPDYVINCAGATGRPNVDWCEDNKQITVRTNILGVLNLVDVCFLKNIPLTNIGTGCIFTYDEEHPVESGKGFKEEDKANFFGSFYSKTRAHLEPLIECYPNLLHLRFRMPISDDLNPRNFIRKITQYEKVVNIPNSMTVLHDLLPIAIEMTKRGCRGIYNFTNPGTISHNQILELYKKYIDPNFTWINFTEKEQNQILKAKRSNNELDSSKLLQEFPNIPSIDVAIEECFKRMQHNLQIN